MLRRAIGRFGSIGFFLAALVTAATAGDACPGPQGGQKFPFDQTYITFDSFSQPKDAIVNCVMVMNAAHPYHVDWPGAQIDASTEKGVLMSRVYLGGAAKIESSTAYVGVNRTKFTPGVLTEKTLFVKLKEAFESRFLGAVSTVARGQSETVREGKLRPVDLRFNVQLTGPRKVHLEFTDNANANPGLAIGFALPQKIRDTVPDLNRKSFPFSREKIGLDYTIGSGEPVAMIVAATLTNSDFQEIGAVPLMIIVSQ